MGDPEGAPSFEASPFRIGNHAGRPLANALLSHLPERLPNKLVFLALLLVFRVSWEFLGKKQVKRLLGIEALLATPKRTLL